MKKYTSVQLSDMTMQQVAEVAKSHGLTLSYKSEAGTRKRYTKGELIQLIANVVAEKVLTATQGEVAATEVTTNSEYKIVLAKKIDLSKRSTKRGPLLTGENVGVVDITKYNKKVDLTKFNKTVNLVKQDQKAVSAPDLSTLAINKVVGHARIAQQKGDYATIQQLADVMAVKIKAEQINAFEVAKMSNVLNILKGMLKVAGKANKPKKGKNKKDVKRYAYN